MANILTLVSNIEFDPSEACIPWKVLTDAGHDVWFASEDGSVAQCDPVTLTGDGLPGHLQSLAAKPENREIYAQMSASQRFQNPLAWKDVDPDTFDALVLPGGHAPGVKPYLESEHVFDICRSFFERKAPVSSVCHGILALARTKKADGKSVLHGYRVSGLNNFQEKIAISLTKKTMGGHYQTYPQTVQDEVSVVLARKKDFHAGPKFPAYGSAKAPSKGFIVEDGHLLCGRWPGDCYKLAHALRDKLDLAR
jgi:protease I